ncbi:MAG: phosphoribosyl-ATP diphosphatase [bacterium]|nr:phosphoribosyl-ATP diphosphatase [bacterium]
MSSEILDRLAEVVSQRARHRPTGSYVVSLLDGGTPAIAAKLREETEELIEAAGADDADHTAHEAADLLFHLWVLLAACELPVQRVYEQLERRFGTSGLAEKAAREGDGSAE